jgi:CheY-like chemotaxis protein
MNVLIVDDSPTNLFVLEEVLSNFYKITSIDKANNGEEAIEILVSNYPQKKY